ncbi:flagellar hook protein FlgE [Serpentinimonas maccroryi]|uniref:Flagellar hook protein FlgE n=1 Tax=Serpentinimonas maccroryi TaxID=1458426 RepID=A0A060NLF0_9BURK|nr:flagellar hook protein FlgE [Serpentinimonas maccroryi]BAO82617.1 flagellar hook protein FlgE [Serpentinimonas maccroryi]
MSFQTGLSGLNAAARNLQVIGHNIANANTTGMKASRAEFAEVYAAALGATGGASAGMGVQVAAIAQLFTQGNLKITGNQLDLAINGAGFFQVNAPDGSPLFTRNGEFKLDKDGFIVTNTGARLQGFDTDALGQRTSAVTRDLTLPTGQPIPPRASGITAANPLSRGIEITANLDAGAAIESPPTAPLTEAQKRFGTALNAFDEQGSPVAVQLYFVKTAANTWQIAASLDNGNSLLAGGGALTFGANGQLVSSAISNITIPAAVAPATVPSSALTIPLTLADPAGTPTLTQFGSRFGVFALTQDGYAAGDLTSIDIAENGVVMARYSNGISRAEGQVALANFRNLQGLQPINGGFWAQTFASGPPTLGGPQEGGVGLVRQNALEESNVELTQELVNMMVAQRSYQANAQTIRTQDQVLQTLVNMR